jgi:hypothetical protein
LDTGTSPQQFASFTQFDKFDPFPSEDSSDVQGGYELTLTNNSPVTAEVSYYAVVFYAGGTEIGDDDEPLANVAYIPQGQSWTFANPTTAMNVGQAGAVNTTDTCALVTWTPG